MSYPRDRRFDGPEINDMGPKASDSVGIYEERYSKDSIYTTAGAADFYNASEKFINEVQQMEEVEIEEVAQSESSLLDTFNILGQSQGDFKREYIKVTQTSQQETEKRDIDEPDYRRLDDDFYGDNDRAVEEINPTLASPDRAAQDVAATKAALSNDSPNARIVINSAYGDNATSVQEGLQRALEVNKLAESAKKELDDRAEDISKQDIMPAKKTKTVAEAISDLDENLSPEMSSGERKGESLDEDLSLEMNSEKKKGESDDKDLQEEELKNSFIRQNKEINLKKLKDKNKDKDLEMELNPSSDKNRYIPDREIKNHAKIDENINKDIQILSRHNEDINDVLLNNKKNEFVVEDSLNENRLDRDREKLKKDVREALTIEQAESVWRGYYSDMSPDNSKYAGVEV